MLTIAIHHVHHLSDDTREFLRCLIKPLLSQGCTIMSQISDFADSVNASLDKLGTGLDGVAADVQFLKDELAKVTPAPEDAQRLEDIKARVGTAADKIAALDALTTPVVAPPAPTA